MSTQPTLHGHRASRRVPRSGRVRTAVRALLAAAALSVLVAGLPWGLVQFVGWPLPHSVPARADVEAALTTPMSTVFLLDVLACVLWCAWALFLVDVARAAVQEVRGLPKPALPTARPLQSLAAALVGSLMLSLLVLRPAASATAAPPPPRAAATAPATLEGTASHPADRQARAGTVEVRAPHDGIYDSLWRIADRTLGDGSRWPEIYALNRGRAQADGRALTDPSMIRPGWILRLPACADARPTPPPHVTAPTERPSPPTTATPPSSTAPATPSAPTSPTPAESAPAPDHDRHDHGAPGLSLPTGAFVSSALAALVVGALAVARRRRRVSYLPGSGDRDDLTIAPVVRALRIGHDQAVEGPEPGVQAPEAEALPAAEVATGSLTLGVRVGQALAWNLARTRGLGLIGPGALDAARALLVTLLADRSADVVAPRPDAELLLGGSTTDFEQMPGLRVVEDLETALAALESDLLRRARATTGANDDEPATRELVLVASPRSSSHRRLQAVLDNGSSLHIAGVLLGQWLPGGTLRIRPDGTVAAASPDLAPPFTGGRLFNLPASDAQGLLDLLRRAAPRDPPRSLALPAAASRTAAGSAPAPPRPKPVRRKLGAGSVTHESPSAHSAEADDEAGSGADEALPAEEPEPDQAPATTLPLELSVLGRVRLTHHLADGNTHADLTASLAPKQREVLAYLALHPDGVRREALAGAVWPDAPRTRPYNSFHATLSQLRRALRTATHNEQVDIAAHVDGRYVIDRNRTAVDLWELRHALNAASEGPTNRRSTVDRILTLYTGDLATDVPAEWIEAPRESLRRDVLDALSTLTRDLRPTHPAEALTYLERARALDPYNEALYRAIARLQAKLGHHDTIPRTLNLLTTFLAELDEHPSPETLTLFADLSRPRRAG